MNKEEEKLKRELIKTSKAIRKKYKDLKLGRAEETLIREQTYKPITEPLKEIIKQAKADVKREIKLEKSSPKQSFKADNSVTKSIQQLQQLQQQDTPSFLNTNLIAESTPDDNGAEANVFHDTLQTSDDVLKLFLDQYDPLPRQYLEKLLKDDRKEIDYTYGVHYDQVKDAWSIGDKPIEIIDADIKINNVTYKGTPGLYELLFMDRPSYRLVKDSDKKTYKQIMEQTNVHKQGFLPHTRVKSNRGYKYTYVIKPLLDETPKSSSPPSSSSSRRKLYETRARRLQTWGGDGISPKLTYNDRSLEYVYWNKPTELVNRLRVLWASKMAGNDNHENEILSIIEELREENIIF